MIGKYNPNRFCSESIENIENYAQAIADNEHVWELHHRGEILPCGVFSKSDLMKFGLYLNRPASELVFLRHDEHRRLHRCGRKLGEDSRRKVSEARKGMKFNKEHCRRISESKLGKPQSEEHKIKISESLKRYWQNRKSFG